MYIHFSASVLALQESKGYFIAVSSAGAQLRVPGASDYCTSKHAVNRLVEFIAIGVFSFLSSRYELPSPTRNCFGRISADQGVLVASW
jgi:hypothetical protein